MNRRLPEEGAVAVRVAPAEAPDDVGLDDGEALAGAVLQVLLDLLAVQPLAEQPARVAQVEERLAVLVDEMAAVGANLRPHPLDGPGGGACFGLAP
jgi:hypothetical protein